MNRNLIPLSILRLIRNIFAKKRKKHKFISGTFGLIKDKYEIK